MQQKNTRQLVQKLRKDIRPSYIFRYLPYNMTDQTIIKSTDQRWAHPFEPPSAILTLSSANRFNRGHHNPCFPQVKSQFTRDFNLSHALNLNRTNICRL